MLRLGDVLTNMHGDIKMSEDTVLQSSQDLVSFVLAKDCWPSIGRRRGFISIVKWVVYTMQWTTHRRRVNDSDGDPGI